MSGYATDFQSHRHCNLLPRLIWIEATKPAWRALIGCLENQAMTVRYRYDIGLARYVNNLHSAISERYRSDIESSDIVPHISLRYRLMKCLIAVVLVMPAGYWWFCLMNFWNFFSIYVFEVKESIAGIPTELPCLGDLENLGQLSVQEVLMILSYEFLKLLQYLCFRGQRIHCWHSHWATLFGWPQKPLEPEVDPDFRGHPNEVAQ